MGVTRFLLALSYLAIAAISFYCGKRVSDLYHADKECAVKDALQRQYLRLVSGSDADDPVQPYSAPRQMIDHQFMDRLHRTGRATKQIS